MIEQSVIQKCLEQWGEDAQLDMVIEEMAELTKAILKYRRTKGAKSARIDIAEEHADVLLMLEQLAYMMVQHDTNYKKLMRMFSKDKISRLEDKLGKWIT